MEQLQRVYIPQFLLAPGIDKVLACFSEHQEQNTLLYLINDMSTRHYTIHYCLVTELLQINKYQTHTNHYNHMYRLQS